MVKLFPLLQRPTHKIYIVDNTVVSKLTLNRLTNYSIVDGCSCSYYHKNKICKHIKMYRGEYRLLNKPLTQPLLTINQNFLISGLTLLRKSDILPVSFPPIPPAYVNYIKIKSKIELQYKYLYYIVGDVLFFII